MLQQMWSRIGASYRAKVGKELASRGLLYEDVMIETTDVKLALSRLPKDVLNAREQRLKRAMVLSSQQRYLPDMVAEKIDPWQPYLSPYLQAIEESKKEEALLAK
mmetsp:Transcript_33580/g.88386  ORF Transcript_33580/g.88386 Transcript_33580/m.88386 type:complete len:105 (-) Transcript_33580:435-749(-)|eukprot:CAMPEP_0115857322 /NCGR_PEP_ID=MMETSP0287-20121206/15516_1 /TAXON_ID=412157 /ORGANISM="Chrysochromulina rotalis, Strain UIO044" /LENGTH=104 /DNA_ID=CAMNT_0003311539 /DNA_START=97 /DNA_END=411 /DNA_ORIENTATION=-